MKRVWLAWPAREDAGQIEVTTTPYAHPILPLLYDTNLVETNDPGAEVPTRFSYPNDAIAQLSIAADVYREKFGREQRGLWPGEGSVAQNIVRIVANAGFRWMPPDSHSGSTAGRSGLISPPIM